MAIAARPSDVLPAPAPGRRGCAPRSLAAATLSPACRLVGILIAFVACGSHDTACHAEPPAARPRPGERPTDRVQRELIAAARRRLAEALATGEPATIEAAEAGCRAALGEFAGVPEIAERRTAPGTEGPRPSADDYSKLTARMASLASGSAAARASRMELRGAAYLAIGLLDCAEAGLPDAARYRRQAAVELEFLLARQTAAGFFPYPADPVAPPQLAKLAAEMARIHPEKVREGYIEMDADGAQFDTGCAAYALVRGHELLGGERFLAAARRAADWAVSFPLSPNWNYNAFSVWQLAKLSAVTGERRHREAAVRIARLGVLPGLMDSGRWSDQHNARSVYHWIMVRGLVELLAILPPDDADAAFIRAKTRLAVEAGVADVLRDGGGNSETAYVALAGAIDTLEGDATWERALEAIGVTGPYAAGAFAKRQARRSAH